MIGQLIKFDLAEIATKLKDYKIDLSPEDQAKFKGKLVVLATAVINTAGVDIAKYRERMEDGTFRMKPGQ